MSCISDSMSNQIRRPSLAVLCMLLTACAAMGPRLVSPKVIVMEVRVLQLDGAQALLGATVELMNPNPTDVDIQGLDAALTIEDEPVATAALVSPVRVPAGGTAMAELSARAGVDALMRAAAAAMRRGAVVPLGRAPTLHYAIEGVALFNGGLRVPFRRGGELGLSGSAESK
jgi:LEA14-like dessication related protein